MGNNGELFQDLPARTEVPEDPGEWSEDFELMVDILGEAAAFRLAEAFAGANLYIPKNILKSRDYLEIRRKYRAGASYRELSAAYGYTESHVRNIIHRGGIRRSE